MNSIEPVSNPEKKGPQPDAPTLRVFVKEGNAYALQSETKDYGQAIKQADKHHEKGKDVLVNEKDNPNIVHVKTNRALDVDIGREIKPSQSQGNPIKGPGEIVLASFYAKLPMDTKAFDERTAKEQPKAMTEPARDGGKAPDERIAVQGAKELAQAKGIALSAEYSDSGVVRAAELKQAQGIENEAYKKLATVSTNRAEALVASERAQHTTDGQLQAMIKLDRAKHIDAVAQRTVDDKRDPAAPKPEAVAIGSKDAKAVLDKTGYALPDSVKGEYTVKDGKFHDRDSSALRFEDHGKKLSTPVEDRKVIAHMVEVATAKNWGTLELKGTDTFKQIAWVEAQARGVETKGYKPTERDFEELAKVKQERGIPEKQVAAPTAPVKSNEIIAAGPSQSKDTPDPAKGKDASGDKPAGRSLTPDEQMRVGVATKLMEKQLAKLPEDARMQAIEKMTIAVKDGTLKLPTPKVTERAIDRPAPAPAPAMERSR